MILFPLFVKRQFLTPTSQYSICYDFLWPLIQYKVGPTDKYLRIPPFVWQKNPSSDTKTLFPLFWMHETSEQKIQLVIPIFFRMVKKNSDLTHKWTFCSAGALPPYYLNYHQDKIRLLLIWPFYGEFETEKFKAKSVLWPLTHSVVLKNKHTSLLHSFLYFRRVIEARHHYNSLQLLIPIWLHQRFVNHFLF